MLHEVQVLKSFFVNTTSSEKQDCGVRWKLDYLFDH